MLCTTKACPPGCHNDGTCYCTGGGDACDRHWNQCIGHRCNRDAHCQSDKCASYIIGHPVYGHTHHFCVGKKSCGGALAVFLAAS